MNGGYNMKMYPLFILVFLLSGCAQHYSPEVFNDPYGFWSGIWHGAIVGYSIAVNILSWVLQLIGVDFLKDIQIIGRPNTGLSYYLGFFIGMLWMGGIR